MDTTRTLVYVALAAVAVTALSAGAAAATTPSGGNLQNAAETPSYDDVQEDHEDPIINIELDEVVEVIEELIEDFSDFTEDWDTKIEEILVSVLFEPFRRLRRELLGAIIDVITYTPDIHPNPSVEEIHRLTLAVTYGLAGLALVATGILYIVGPVLGVSYAEARMTLPRIIAALVFASVSPVLLQYTVELADVLVEAFKPGPVNLPEALGLGSGQVIAWVSESAVLLTLIVMFLIRAVYILFTAAISPVVALAWAFPTSRPYANELISGYWTALMMAPVDVLALRFALEMLDGSGATLQQSVGNWIVGVAAFTLLIILPYQLHSASRTAVRAGSSFSHDVSRRAAQYPRTDEYARLKQRGRRRVRQVKHRLTENRFDNDDEDDDNGGGGW